MAWQDRYQAGSFREASFVTDRHSLGGGRRVAVHQYPRRDLPYAEDMGRAARSFQLDCFVRGQSYMTERDALVEALEAAGAGTLVHPYFGSLRVAVLSYRVTESTADGGVARFSIDFVEAGENEFPTAAANTPRAVESRATAASSAVEAQFVSAYSVEGQPEFVSSSALQNAQGAILKLQGLANTGPALIAEKTAYLRSLTGSLTGLSNSIRSPASLASGLLTQIRGLANLWPRPRTAVARYEPLRTFGSDFEAVVTSTPTRTRQAANQAAIAQLVRQGAVIEAARSSRLVTFDSAQAAAALREDLAETLDVEMASADDLTYPALADLRVAVIRDLTARGASLARVTSYRPTATLPALVLAHELYGDASQATAIIDRNPVIRHPGFVTGGQALEVLTHA